MPIVIFGLFVLSLPLGEHLAQLVDDVFDGDPVSLSTGLYLRSDDDLTIEGAPVTLTRTYRTRDDVMRPFGIGASHSYNLYLIGDGQAFQWAELIMADGGRIRYRRVTTGRTHNNATFEHTESPTEFYGSLLEWNGGGWNIDLRDGTRYSFGACAPRTKEVCHLLAISNRAGNETRLQYDPATDDLKIIQADEGRWIALSYDSSHRIIGARTSTEAAVTYEYDGQGRLARTTRSDGRIQEYAYGSRHEMRTIREPDRGIVNTYDADLRCVKQVITHGARGQSTTGRTEVYEFSYRINAQGKIIETKTVQPTGTVRIATFNANGYLVTDTSDAGGPTFTEVVYARDDKTNLAPRVTVRCAKGGQIVEAFSPVGEFDHPDDVRGRLIASTCR
jgi:YD repeat-containing protein